MPKASRIGDIGVGVCCCHSGCKPMSGIIVTGASKHTTCNSPTARVGDIVLGFCGHVGILVTGCDVNYVENRRRVKIGDVFVGCFTGVIVTGCDTYTICGR